MQAFDDPAEFLQKAAYLPEGCVLAQRHPGDWSGVELVRRLRDLRLLHEAFLIVSESETEVTFAVEAMKAGARDVLRKPVVPETLLPPVARSLEGDRRRPAARNPVHELTPREREVLRGILDGQTNREIARDLGISARTVEAHRSALMAKMGVTSAAALVRRALAGWAH